MIPCAEFEESSGRLAELIVSRKRLVARWPPGRLAVAEQTGCRAAAGNTERSGKALAALCSRCADARRRHEKEGSKERVFA